jgi:hypothetical protein
MKHCLCIAFILLASGCAPSGPVDWTPELVTATHTTFVLPGEWRFTARSGSDFGSRCDILFDTDGTYRKSCRPPEEESGDWDQVGEWDGRTMKVRLSDRVDLIEKEPIDDATVDVVVESPDHRRITFDGDPYERR